MVIVLHYLNGWMGGALDHVQSGSINYYLSHFIESLCIIAVNVFVIITGYFSYKRTRVNLSKVVKLFLIMIFWGLLLSLVTVLALQKRQFSIHLAIGIIEASFSQWFVVIYCILYLTIPFLNVVTGNIKQSSFRALLGIGLFFFYVWPTFFTAVPLSDGGYGIVNFVFLYLIGTYIHKYYNKRVAIPKSLLVYLLMVVLTTIFSLFAGRAWSYNSIFNLIGSVAFFEIFKSLNIKHNKVINQLASYTFSVYLIDVNAYFNRFLYRSLFHSNDYWNNNLMIVNLVVALVGIYFICILLDWLRELCLGRSFNYLSNKTNFWIQI